MVDRYRFSTLDVRAEGAANSYAIGILDIEIHQRFQLDLGDMEGVQAAFQAIGLGHVLDALQLANKLGQEERTLISIPWTDAPDEQFDPEAIIRLLTVANRKIWIRIEGTPAAGLWAVVSSGGMEARFDFSESKFEQTIKAIDRQRKELQAFRDSTTDAEKKKNVEILIEVFNKLTGNGDSFADQIATIYKLEKQRAAESDRVEREKVRREEDGIQRGTIGTGGAGGAGNSIGGVRGGPDRMHGGL